MQFSPRFHKTLLATRQVAANLLDRVNPINGRMVLLIRMKVRPMIRSCFAGHNNAATGLPRGTRGKKASHSAGNVGICWGRGSSGQAHWHPGGRPSAT